MSTFRARLLAVGSAVALLATLLAMTGAEAEPPGKPITVMTRNVYLGADINRPVQAATTAQAQGKSPQEVVFALARATHVTRGIVDYTNFTVRAELLADEIARTKPDLVGLQEVALRRSGPLELGAVGVPNATRVDYDYLEILLDALSAAGMHYDAVNVGLRADVEAPSFSASPFSPDARDVRMTMRDVILVRSDAGLMVTGTGNEIFSQNLAVTIAGTKLNFDRGYNWVDVRAGAERFRFINSHLEAFSSDLTFAQAAELLAEAVPADRTTVFVCDCNSDPLNTSIKPHDQLPHKAAYGLIVGAGGFTDQWLEHAPASEGWTAGLSETVDDPDAEDIDHRIDMIFARTAEGSALAVQRGKVTGDETDDRDPDTRLWPSDHAGVVLRMRGY